MSDGISTEIIFTDNALFSFAENVKRGLKNNTFAGYRYSYTQYVQPRFGHKKLVDVKKSDVRNFYNTYNHKEKAARILPNVLY